MTDISEEKNLATLLKLKYGLVFIDVKEIIKEAILLVIYLIINF